MSILNRAGLATALLAVAPLASAGSTSADLKVSIEIVNSCSVTVPPAGLDFGQSTLATDATGTVTISVDCSNTGAVTLAFNDSGSGDFANRQMTNGTDNITYSLHQESSTGALLGDGTMGSSTWSKTVTGGATEDFVVAGLAPSGQGVKPIGSYQDVVTVAVTF